MKKIAIVVFIVLNIGCTQKREPDGSIAVDDSITNNTPILSFFVQNSFPHDSSLFTEGLFIKDGLMYESTGAPVEFPDTRSEIGLIDLKTGKFSPKIEIDRKIYFGEGIAMLNNKLYQLTYKNQQGFIYDAKSYQRLRDFKYANAEGWGLTTDGKSLIMSDGTANLTWIDPNTLKPLKTLQVTERGVALSQINELEYAHDLIYANVWQTNYIVQIDPKNGQVLGKMDLSSVVAEQLKDNPDAQELNGIAFDTDKHKFYITGKMWSKVYELDFPGLKAKD
ncbi:glutaminyl-peptide cyclotransferase [Pedobacter duraquae]|nr:glutaminyl-peptide cyclotransferase [Pedobacter duraquae]